MPLTMADKGEEWRSPDHHFAWFAKVKGVFARKSTAKSDEADKVDTKEVMSNTTSRTLYPSEPSSEKAKADDKA